MVSQNIRLLFALFIAFVLSILPLPEIMVSLRPPWLLMFVLYIQFYLPNYFNVTLVLILGVCLDVLLSTVIGEHAFALLLTTWFAAGKTRRFKFFSSVQQMMLVGFFSSIYQLIIFFVDAYLGYNNRLWMVFGTAFLSLLLWPWVIRILSQSTLEIRRNYY